MNLDEILKLAASISDLTPITSLKPIIEIAIQINGIVGQIKDNKKQLESLREYICVCCVVLHQSPEDPGIKQVVARFHILLKEVRDFVITQREFSFFKLFKDFASTATKIEEYHTRINQIISSTQLYVEFDSARYLRTLSEKQNQDMQAIKSHLETIKLQLRELADVPNMLATMAKQLVYLDDATRSMSVCLMNALQDASTKQLPLDASRASLSQIIVKEIVRGGKSSVVRQATWHSSTVAVKFYTAVEDPISFRTEIKTWANLHHPNVIELFAVSDTDSSGELFAVMPFFRNRDAISYLHNFPYSDRTSLAAGTAAGLAYLHSREVIHGELRAKNILIDDMHQVKLSNFGYSRMKTSTFSLSDDPSPSKDPRWQSPEQHRRHKVDYHSDVWSLGITFYELITSQMPWDGEDDDSVREKIINGAIPPMPASGSIPRPVWEHIRNCCSFEPPDRPRAAAISKALASYLEEVRNRQTPPDPQRHQQIVDHCSALAKLLMEDGEHAKSRSIQAEANRYALHVQEANRST